MCNPIPTHDFLYEYPTEEPTVVNCPRCQLAVHFQSEKHTGQRCRCGYFVQAAWANGRPRLANPITAVVVSTPKPTPQAQVGWVVVDTAPRLAAPEPKQLPEPERFPLPAWLTDSDRAAISDIRRMADALRRGRP